MNRTAPLLVLVLLGAISVRADILYETDFDNFPAGDNAWAGFDGWLSNDPTSGAQAIDGTVLGGALGNVAALGFNRPASTFTTVFRPINYDPVVGGNALVEFRAVFAIQDSLNGRRDDFFFSFYNISGDLLAAIRISNVDADMGFWRQDGFVQAGGTEVDTGQTFVRGEIYTLSAVIDLNANTWTAALEGVPLFEDAPFNGTGLSRTLGPVAVEWSIAGGSTFLFGDNWMLLDYFLLETVEAGLPPLLIDSVTREPSGNIVISWQATPGFDYIVEYSADLINWFGDLPNSTLAEPPAPQTFQFTDPTTPLPASRFYRLRRVNSS